MIQNENQDVFDLKYCRSLAKELIIKGKVEFDIEEIKPYFTNFFYPMHTGDYMKVEGRTTQIYNKVNLKQVYLDALPKSFSEYFFTEYLERFNVICDPLQPRCGAGFINVFGGFRHERKPYNTFSNDTKMKVEMMLNYIKDVLASGKEENYNFIMKWYANMLQCGKNQSVLYLKGPEGIGKSTITEFLRDHVLGLDAYKTGRSKYLTTSFNKPLMGALLVCYEELPVFSEREWEAVSATIKNSVTSAYEDYEDKFEKTIPNVRNLNNYIINTNVEAIKHSEGRRYYIADISTHRQGDLKFWEQLHKNCFNDEVGSAFYNYCCEIDVKDFNSQDFPQTEAKRVAIIERLPYEYRFLKDQYIYPEQSIKKIPLDELYQKYVTYMKSEDKKPSSKFKFTAMLRDININYSHSGSVNYYDVSLSKLKEIANKKKWLHELDNNRNIDPFSEPEPSKLDTNEQIILDLQDKLTQKNEEIAKLKQMLEQLQQKPKEDKYVTKMKQVDTLLENIKEYLNKNQPIKMPQHNNKSLEQVSNEEYDPFIENENVSEEQFIIDHKMLDDLVSEFNKN